MQISFVIILFSFYKKISSYSEINSVQSVSKAISDVIHEFYFAKNIKFDFIIYGEKSNHINDVIDEVTKDFEIPMKLTHVKNLTSLINFNDSAVIFIKSTENLNKLHFYTYEYILKLTTETFKKFKFLIYVEEIQTFQNLEDAVRELNHTFSFHTSDIRFFEFFITADDKFVNLSANLFYSENHCGQFKPNLLNSFNISAQNWNQKLQNFDHFNNFHGCMISFAFKYSEIFYIKDIGQHKFTEEIIAKINFQLHYGEPTYGGSLHEIIETLAEIYNFTAHYTCVTPVAESLDFIKFHTKNYEVFDWSFYGFDIDFLHRNLDFHYTLPFTDTEYFYLISYNDLYNNYEKLLFPFDATTWLLLLLTFGLTLITILVLRFASQYIRTIIYGKGVKTPGFNALSIFFGISQIKLPTELFCRIILILFIWFCLMFRTCWQSKMFEFMTTDMRKPLPASIEDLKEMNYTIVLPNFGDSNKVHDEFISGRERPNIVKLTIEQFCDLYKQVLDRKSTTKYAFFVQESEHHLLNSTYDATLPRMENERIKKEKGFAMKKNGMLVERLTKIMEKFIPTGVIKHLDDFAKWYMYRHLEMDVEDPKRVLSMTDLEFGFVIFLGFLSLAIFVFICELHALYVRRQLRKLIGLYEFVRVIRERLKDYHDKKMKGFYVKRKRKKLKIFLFLLLLLIFLAICHKTSSNSVISKFSNQKISQPVSKAISDVIHEFYITQNIKFDFIIYGEKSYHINDVFDEVTKKVNEKISITLKHITNIQDWNHELNRSAVIYVRTKENLRVLQYKTREYLLNDRFMNQSQLKNSGYEKLKFLIYCEQMESVSDFGHIFKGLRIGTIGFLGNMELFEFFIAVNKQNIHLLTNQLYSPTKCGNFIFQELYYMNIFTQKWDEPLKNFDHYTDFHGCMLSFNVMHSFLFYLIYHPKRPQLELFFNIPNDTNIKYAGITYEVIEILARRSNFTPNYIILKSIDPKNFDYRTKKYFENVQRIFPINPNTLNYYEPEMLYTQSFSSETYYFLISYNDLYTNYEKLTMPFDDLTWIFLLLTFGLTFATIFGLKFCPHWIRTIIFGRGINNPGYNALGIFFGISQLRLPRESFCRSLLLIFIWFCLIIRTCWQSMMFEFMTTDMRKPLPASLDDLRKMNYTVMFCMDTKMNVFQKELNGRKSPQIVSVDKKKLMESYNSTLDGKAKSKFAFLLSTIEHASWNKTFKRSLPIMENVKIKTTIAFGTQKNNILNYQLNQVINHLIPSGILNNLLDYGKWYLYRPIHIEPEDSKRVLSMSDLQFGFVIFLGFMSLPIVVFICELHALYVRRQLRKLLGLYEFVRVIRERLKDYHDKW
ncbi:hypothetical protein PVAND_001515 [Polypedilum vanderplanki]|uniref:Ionotropic receptor n=1 Tax=Polypedilum vanderplanki TaxID=319348 RepID=A0A9J6BPF5_POLVA|nr:hypothetical protein PVAND_001515 [Polypedilum vanderplanki]